LNAAATSVSSAGPRRPTLVEKSPRATRAVDARSSPSGREIERVTSIAPPIATTDDAIATAISTASACMSNITTPESTTAAIGSAPTIRVSPTRRAWTVLNRPSAIAASRPTVRMPAAAASASSLTA